MVSCIISKKKVQKTQVDKTDQPIGIQNWRSSSKNLSRSTKKVLNLKAHCKRLTTNPISQKWIISRAKNGSDDESLAPKEWIEYISS